MHKLENQPDDEGWRPFIDAWEGYEPGQGEHPGNNNQFLDQGYSLPECALIGAFHGARGGAGLNLFIMMAIFIYVIASSLRFDRVLDDWPGLFVALFWCVGLFMIGLFAGAFLGALLGAGVAMVARLTIGQVNGWLLGVAVGLGVVLVFWGVILQFPDFFWPF